MKNCIPRQYNFINEKVLSYKQGSPERKELEAELAKIKESLVEIPVIIGGKEIRTGNKGKCIIPHNNKKVIGEYHKAGKKEAELAITEALKAREKWAQMDWQSRANIFLRAAELASGPWRAKLNAATMLTQSKTYKQAEIDSACELIDFIRYNVACLYEIYSDQPISTGTVINRMEYRPLEGFIYAVSPFNFTAIASNLPGSPAIMGNTIVWKPATNAVYSNYVVYQLFKEAGLPDGVINFIPGDAKEISDVVMNNENLAGVHFTGSTEVFEHMWTTVGKNITNYRTFPKLVGETGGKNSVIAHPSANIEALCTGLLEGAFEYQGQKCSAASRAYIPKSIWPDVKENLLNKVRNISVGDVEDFTNFMAAVIDKKSFDKIKDYIDYAENSSDAEILIGGKCDDTVGYFIEPTVILTTNPHFKTMEEEIFGPVLTVYVYEDEDFSDILKLSDSTSKYGLTGSIYATDRYAIMEAEKVLVNAAGNFYINVKPTAAVVGQQPFGGARKSGTNDKAGSKLNLLRWVSPRSIKENLLY